MKKDKSFSIDFVVRKVKNNPIEGYLSCKVTVDRVPTEISLNEKVLFNVWDSRREEVTGRSREANSLNEYIKDVRFRVTESKRALEAGRYEVTCDTVRDHYYNKHISQLSASSGHTIIELLQKHDKLEGSEGKKLKPGTVKNYTATEKYVTQFVQHYFKEPDVDLIRFDYEAVLELEAYIRNNPLRKHDPCLGNGVYKHMERLSKMLTIAAKIKWISQNPFDLYQAKKARVVRQRMKIEHFVKVETAVFDNETLTFVQDLFLYDCYVGVSYIDLIELDDTHFEEMEGTLFCTTYRQKSIELAGIPVPRPAIEIMNKYRNTLSALWRGKIFPYISNQEFNRGLKVISGILRLPFELNTRMARSFFARELNLKNGVPLETVSKMLGHSKISTTKEHYADVDEEKIMEDTANVQQRFTIKKQRFSGRNNFTSN